MKKINTNTKLLAYSSSTALFLMLAEQGNAQVMYTDVDPDVLIEAPGGTYSLDVNNDAIADFILSASSAGTYILNSTGSNIFYGIHAVFADPQNPANSIAGTGTAAFVYPYALDAGAVIGPVMEFHNNSFQSVAYNFHAVKHGTEYISLHEYGNWLGGVTDKFLGLKFTAGGSTYFGWLRMDVNPSNNAFTIKDFAYEASPSAAITTTVGVAIDEVKPGYALAIYTFGDQLIIAAKNNADFEGHIAMYDLGGNIVLQEAVHSAHTSFDIAFLPASLYIVKLMTPGNVFSAEVHCGR